MKVNGTRFDLSKPFEVLRPFRVGDTVDIALYSEDQLAILVLAELGHLSWVCGQPGLYRVENIPWQNLQAEAGREHRAGPGQATPA